MSGLLVYLPGGEHAEFADADGYQILGEPLPGVLKIWRTDPAEPGRPYLLAVFAVGGWLGLKGDQLVGRQYPFGFESSKLA
jgi:hypothetical protein